MLRIVNINSSTEFSPCVILISNEQMLPDGHDFYRKIKKSCGCDFNFCIVYVEDWDDALTPWETDARLNGRAFGGHGPETLSYIVNECVSEIRKIMRPTEIYIAGYSLAGLFALWSLYNTDAFDGAVCCSGSLWYPDLTEYVRTHCLKKEAKIYLSLGRKEPKARNPLMGTVGDATRDVYEMIQADGLTKACTFEWNEGSHFTDPEGRVARGIEWVIS